MTAALFSMRAVILEQRERSKNSSRADIERFIEESELKLASLESQNSAVELRDRERACVAALKDLIAPIRILPVELLANIFSLAIRDDQTRRGRVSTIADLREGTPDGAREQVYVEELKTFLLRSAPLTIPITLVDSRSINHRILDEVLGTATRWHSLALMDWDQRIAPSFVSRLADCKLNNLEQLGPLIFDDDVDLVALPSFTTVPRLRKLNITFFSNVLPTFLPWAQLTHLNFTSGFPDTALDILTQCPNIIQAIVHTPAWTVLPEARRNVFTLSDLRALNVRFTWEGQHFVPLTDCLSAPALEELVLNLMDKEIDRIFWTSVHFTAFQLRAPNITSLRFHESCLTSDDLMDVLRHAPALTELRLISCRQCFNDVLISSLCYNARTRPLAPRLHHLRLHNLGHHFTKDMLVRMITSRWWIDAELAAHPVPPPVARWTCVRLEYFSDPEELTDMLRDLPSNVLTIF
ncbi:hypothetical protein C8R45DRAFT_1091873 [Mycena sanguinolenta]|nr:hypothetical protein C8R45DRAFT_1091873 [Mycena sanguinolenta]